jgi:CheY-like chemotaxis protein
MSNQIKEPRILVVNASLDLLNLFHAILDKEQGYEIELSNFSFEGIRMIEQLHPDLIILDFEREGQIQEWQLLQMIRLNEQTTHIPIILSVVPWPLFRDQREYFREKDVYVLLKPFRRSDLLELVRQILPPSYEAH